jgi:hypothetical protein
MNDANQMITKGSRTYWLEHMLSLPKIINEYAIDSSSWDFHQISQELVEDV